MKRTGARRVAATVMLALLAATPHLFGSEETELDRQGIVIAVTEALKGRYVYPEVATQMAADLQSKLANGEYDEITELNGFANQLTNDLRETSEDGHIIVYPFEAGSTSATLADALSEQDIAKHARNNFGFVKAERLAGNVGYVKLDNFDFAEIGGPTATAAMNFVGNCDALIIDLRENRGGKKDMVQFLASYFFSEPTHFLTVFDRNNEVLEQTRSLAYVPGKRMFDTPILILTSHQTGSAAEAFSYNMKSFERATIVGETTKGIAHWIDPVDFPDYGLRLHLPYARPESSVTHTSWEKVGVQPDIEVPADKALATAHLEALTMLIANCAEQETRRILDWEMVEARAKAEPMEWSRKEMLPFTGVYGDGEYSVVIEDGRLCWLYSADERYFLLPMVPDVFVFASDKEIRFLIHRDEKGAVSGFQLVYSDGYQGRVWPRTGDLP